MTSTGEQFLSEIKVTENLQHPNLLPLFDSGEAAGLLYYVMPYERGGTRAPVRRVPVSISYSMLPNESMSRRAVIVLSAVACSGDM